MAVVVRMPKLSDTMEEGTVVEWHKKVGDKVEIGELIAEIETDKATMDFDSPAGGVLLYIGVEKGNTVPVDAVLAIFGKSGEDYQALLSDSAANMPATPAPEKAASPTAIAPAPPAPAMPSAPAPVMAAAPLSVPMPSSNGSGSGRVLASPLAKKMAKDAGIDIAKVKGSGDEGRIIRRDIENFKTSEPAVAAIAPAFVLPGVAGEESFTETGLSQMRKTIARRLSESKFGAPHFYLTMEINMEKTIEARNSINEISPVKISFNDLVIKAAALALRQNPNVNSSWLGDKIRYNNHIHIGMAVAVEEGLLVPVIRFADSKTLSHIAAETKDLAGKAKDKKLQPEQMQGNTFSISNLGMMDIEEFTAIINPPDACILAIGRIKEEPVVKNGAIVIGHTMKVTLSCDHRVVDGAKGAKFLQSFKSFLEEPVRMMV